MDAGWAFVDVETTGLNPSWDRVVSVSVLALDAQGRLDGELHTLVDPQRDPGPVHIHGLTSERLAGAPLFHELAPRVRDLVHGRVLVAHNAQFDYRFLHAESERSSVSLPTTHRLCTVALSRRLDLPVDDHKLATVAAYWGVRQLAAHDARDDVRVLREVFAHSEALARQLGVELPVMPCTGRGAVVHPASIPRVPSVFVNPKTWVPPARLVQGMKIVITGPTARPRLELARDLSERGFDVMNSVSSQTRLVVCNEPGHASVKHDKARAAGIPVVTETQLHALLDDIEPGILRTSATGRSKKPAFRSGRPSASPAGPWADRTVLVLGGSAEEAAVARERVGELGARVLVNLGARTTHALCLPGAERDRRHATILERGIALLTPDDLLGPAQAPSCGPVTAPPAAEVGSATPTAGAVAGAPPVVLARGHVIDLPADAVRFSLAASWRLPSGSAAEQVGTPEPVGTHQLVGAGQPFEVDVVAFALTVDDRVAADEDFVFYNQPSSPDGAVRLTVDGSCEQGVDVDLEALPDEVSRIRVAAAIDGDATFGAVGAIRMSLTDAETGTEMASATLDAATEERTLVLADLYRRNGAWRFRAVGQGYEHDLARLATDLGVQVG
jgi:DNA polymerase III subunit epsilon